ncbi:MAG: LOG family protein [Planctomycetota bacterium]
MNCICVFSGSSPGRRPEYRESAVALGRELVARRLRLVYGGSNRGLMTVVANTVLEEGGQVTGVIPQALVDEKVAHTGLRDLRVVDSMHERKAIMAELADGFIALPGGLGTLEELCEAVTWAQLGLHSKPCGLLDVCNYFQGLKDLFRHMIEERFVTPDHERLLLSAADPGQLLDLFERHRPVHLSKWIDGEAT